MNKLRKSAEVMLQIVSDWHKGNGYSNGEVIRAIDKLSESLEQPQDKCRCGLHAGDGCQYCNRELHIETLEQRIDDLEAELKEQPQQDVRRLSDDEIKKASNVLRMHEIFGSYHPMIPTFANAIMDACNIPKEGE